MSYWPRWKQICCMKCHIQLNTTTETLQPWREQHNILDLVRKVPQRYLINPPTRVHHIYSQSLPQFHSPNLHLGSFVPPAHPNQQCLNLVVIQHAQAWPRSQSDLHFKNHTPPFDPYLKPQRVLPFPTSKSCIKQSAMHQQRHSKIKSKQT